MKWKTAIGSDEGGSPSIRSHQLSELIEKHSFVEVIFLLLAKRLPKQPEEQMFNMLLVACADHGIAAPSIFSARTSASVGNPLNASLAAGLLATGQWHGGAVENCAKYLQSETSATTIVGQALSAKERLAGLGHKIYKEEDPRAVQLLSAARSLEVASAAVEKMLAVQSELEAQSGKKLPINIDGALAAILSDMGVSWRITNGVFLLGRLPSMMAHIEEELVNEKPYRRLDKEDIEFIG